MIGVFLGSFDPPHIGHVNVITAALNSGLVDVVAVIPAFKNVWKDTSTSFGLRYEMTKMMFKGIPNVAVIPVEEEIGEGNPVPTYKTLDFIRERHPFRIITSIETYQEIPQWQQGERILKENEFVIVDASHFDNSSLDYRTTENIIYAPDIDICSTTIRNMVKEGKIIAPFVTDEISELIYNHQLYK